MSQTLQLVIDLVARQEIQISDHGYDELAAGGILVRDIIVGIEHTMVVEDYPKYHKGPRVLVLQESHDGKPIHLVWGILRYAVPPVVVPAYRPDPGQCPADIPRRRS